MPCSSDPNCTGTCVCCPPKRCCPNQFPPTLTVTVINPVVDSFKITWNSADCAWEGTWKPPNAFCTQTLKFWFSCNINPWNVCGDFGLAVSCGPPFLFCGGALDPCTPPKPAKPCTCLPIFFHFGNQCGLGDLACNGICAGAQWTFEVTT
jgi:hypothetical protein